MTTNTDNPNEAQSTLPVSKGHRIRTLLQGISSSFRAGAHRIALANEQRIINNQITGRQQELDSVYIDVGTRVQSLPPGANEPVAHRQNLNQCQKDVDSAQEMLKECGDELKRCQDDFRIVQAKNASRKKQSEDDLASASTEHNRLTAVEQQHETSHSEIKREINILQAHQANASAGKPTPKPAEVLTEEIHTLEQKKAEKAELLKKAKMDAAAAGEVVLQKKSTLQSVKSEISEQESKLASGSAAARKKHDEMFQRVSDAKDRLQMSRKNIGKALYESHAIPSECDNLIVQANSIAANIEDANSKLAGVKLQIAEIAPAVRRLVIGIAITSIVVIVLASLVSRRSHRDRDDASAMMLLQGGGSGKSSVVNHATPPTNKQSNSPSTKKREQKETTFTSPVSAELTKAFLKAADKAAESDNSDMTKIQELLKQSDKIVNACSKNGWTALHIACQEGRYQLAKLLLEAGANPNAPMGTGRSSISDSVEPSDESTLVGLTPLHLAVKRGPEITELLLLNKADPKLRTTDDYKTPLHMTDSISTMKLLIKYGADINSQDRYGRTRLMTMGKPYMNLDKLNNDSLIGFRTLLEAGADPNIKNNEGNTALDFAKHNTNPDSKPGLYRDLMELFDKYHAIEGGPIKADAYDMVFGNVLP